VTLPRFELLRPTTLDEVVEARSADALPFCGGTELLLAMRMGLLRPPRLIDLKRVPALREVSLAKGQVTIGAAATHDQLARDPDLQHHLPMLAHVEANVGNARVRVQGSIGGNLVFAEPKSDVTAALIALDGRVTLRSAASARTVPMEEFILGAYWADIEDGEILTEVSVPVVAGRRAVYEKFQTMERPTVGVAARCDADGSCRVVVAAATGEPVTFDRTSLDAVDARAFAAELDVVPDLTGGERYKRHLAAVVIDRALARLRAEEDR
jgi:carbon-monoxide dehydrogenase medium subunit